MSLIIKKIIQPAGVLFFLLFSLLSASAFATESHLVAVLLSADEPAYEEAARSFIAEYNRPVRQFSLHGRLEEVPRVMDEILVAKPSLILALGAKAAYAAKVWTAKTGMPPVLFAMVINWRHFNFIGTQKNILGIDTAPPPGSELAYLTMFAPKVRRIGMIYSRRSKETVEQISKNAAMLGLELIVVSIDQPDEFQTSFKRLSRKIDGFIAIRDPQVYTLENLDWLADRCSKAGIACLGRSPELAERGLMLTVSPGPVDLALQAVSMTEAILKGDLDIANAGVTPPLSVRVVLNLTAADKLNMVISEAAMDTATDILP